MTERQSRPVNSNDDSKIAAILARFPGPVTLYPSKVKLLLVLLGSLVFSTGGYWMIQEGQAFWGWFDLIFFSLGVIMIPIARCQCIDSECRRFCILLSVPPPALLLAGHLWVRIMGRAAARPI
jgi:hypothetical protein